MNILIQIEFILIFQEVEFFVYQRIVDRACATNAIFDHYASQGM
jgi:hypothetical protein